MEVKQTDNVPSGGAALYIAPDGKITVIVSNNIDRQITTPEALVFSVARAVITKTGVMQELLDDMFQAHAEHVEDQKMVDELAEEIRKEMENDETL